MAHISMRKFCLAGALAALFIAPALAQCDDGPARSHMSVPDPARLDGAQAEAIYRSIETAMANDYAEAGDPVAREYQQWKRINAAPYRSAAHGARFVNNYANEGAAPAYASLGRGGRVPEGGILVKDSFIVTEVGQVMTGPLFLMEKREPGFSPETGDWLFMAITPEGRTMGPTGGPDGASVAFCAACHLKAGPARDYLYFMPEAARSRPDR